MAAPTIRQAFAQNLIYLRSYRRTPAAFRPYLIDAIGLWARGQRQFRAWTPHLNKTLAVLDTTIDDIASRPSKINQKSAFLKSTGAIDG